MQFSPMYISAITVYSGDFSNFLFAYNSFHSIHIYIVFLQYAEHVCLNVHNFQFWLKYSCKYGNSPKDVMYISVKNVSSSGFLNFLLC